MVKSVVDFMLDANKYDLTPCLPLSLKVFLPAK